jgi:hypothetical protein
MVLLALVVTTAGCVPQQQDTRLVSANAFGAPPAAAPRPQVSFKPASSEAAARVEQVAQKVLAANKQTGLRPLIRTIGAPVGDVMTASAKTPEPEVFHHGTAEIFVTEGLVKQCPSEGELAAVLCSELAKMVAQREALAASQTRLPERRPPMDVPVGNDNAGSFGPADQTHLAELAKFDDDRRRASRPAPPPPDPQKLARLYLERAGYPAASLDVVAPVLQAAAKNGNFEKQLLPQTPARP